MTAPNTICTTCGHPPKTHRLASGKCNHVTRIGEDKVICPCPKVGIIGMNDKWQKERAALQEQAKGWEILAEKFKEEMKHYKKKATALALKNIKLEEEAKSK